MKKISVITTFYNAESFIERSIYSVLNQITDADIIIEYILVNDCSTDHSLDIVNDVYEKKNMTEKSNIHMYIYNTNENIGCGAARKFGIEKATGDYFMFLDADDYYINNDFVIRAYQDITNNNADIIEYGIVFNDPNVGIINNVVPRKYEFNSGKNALLAMFDTSIIKFNVWSKIYTKEIIHSREYSSEREYEDIRTVPYWILNANKIIVMPSIEINYRANANSIIRNDEITTRLGTIKAFCDIVDSFKDDIIILRVLYKRALIDISAVMENKNSLNDGFTEMEKYNNILLSYIKKYIKLQ